MPIEVKKNDDGSWTVYYFGKEAGFIEPIRISRAERSFRAVSVHGRLTHTHTLEGAKQFLLENYA